MEFLTDKIMEYAQMSRAPTSYPVPTNVLVAKSVPQQDILAHPKTRLFVTHGSINAAMESVFHGVPMVTMPIFTDQGRELSTWSVVAISFVAQNHHKASLHFLIITH